MIARNPQVFNLSSDFIEMRTIKLFLQQDVLFITGKMYYFNRAYNVFL